MSVVGRVLNRYRVSGDPLRTQRRLELLLVVLVLVLLLQLLYSSARLAAGVAPAALPPAEDAWQMRSAQSRKLVDATASEGIRARPLFWEGRRALDAEAANEAEARAERPGELKDVTLQGVFGAGETVGIIALVKNKKRRILQGEMLEGWLLDEVSPNRIVLVNGGRREVMQLLPGKIVEPVQREDQVAPETPAQAPRQGASPPVRPVPPADNAAQAQPSGLSLGGAAPPGKPGDK
tara:strand:- start:49706 stop:50413 length:708 start_codon:yes stop_codon:yes gene_type:complete